MAICNGRELYLPPALGMPPSRGGILAWRVCLFQECAARCGLPLPLRIVARQLRSASWMASL